MGVASGGTIRFLIVLVQACIAGRRSTAKGASACIVASEASACNQHMHAGCMRIRILRQWLLLPRELVEK